ncbi:MAG: hypothetical protein QQN63_13215, partial [Nitrosopumilus sp.]
MQPKKQKTIIYSGGLDLVTPALEVPQGKLLEVKNIECSLNGGYRVMSGYERADGRLSPVEQPFWALRAKTPTGTFIIGEQITGNQSGAVGTIITFAFTGGTEERGFHLVNVVGIFEAVESVVGATSGAVSATDKFFGKNVTISNSVSFNAIRLIKELF